jgi:ABC-2 type transport system ATP-binding protein
MRRRGMIKVEDLTKYYGSLCAVDHISFEIRKGEILGLLGPNGAGKSTTLRILTCFFQPTSGNVSVKDYNIYDHPLEIKGLIGYLPETAPLYHEMLVYDYLRFVADIRGFPKEKQLPRIKEISSLCGLQDVMHRSVNELSRGYKQRVGIGHAMLSDPEILILDEPTAGLDPNQIVEIRNIIKEIGKAKTVILSTHILSEAEATCDRVVIINKGKIVADGPTESLKEESGSSYDIHLSLQGAEYTDVEQVLSALSSIRKISRGEDTDHTVNLVLSCSAGEDIRSDLYQIIKQKDWSLLEFHRESRTLENLFRELTKEG